MNEKDLFQLSGSIDLDNYEIEDEIGKSPQKSN